MLIKLDNLKTETPCAPGTCPSSSSTSCITNSISCAPLFKPCSPSGGYTMYYNVLAKVVPIINNIAYNTVPYAGTLVQVTPPGGFPTENALRSWVCSNLRFATLQKSETQTQQSMFVTGWGPNTQGYAPVPNLTGIKQVSAGAFHTLALFFNGTVTGWGRTNENQLKDLNLLTGVEKISAGGYHNLFLFNNGRVSGNGNNYTSNLPTNTSFTGVKDISAGGFHSLVLFNNGSITGWGQNQAAGAQNVPLQLTTGNGIVDISAGSYHSLALIKKEVVPYPGYNGTIFITGLTGWGSYNTENKTAAETLTGEYKMGYGWKGLSKISAGSYHSLAVINKWIPESSGSSKFSSIGFVTGWGRNDPPVDGGVGPDIGLVRNGLNLPFVKNVYAGPYHSVAQFEDGSIESWGRITNASTPSGMFQSVSVNYDFCVGTQEKVTKDDFQNLELNSNWPFNDLYWYGCEINLVPC